MRLPLLRRMLNVAALGTGVALAAFTASPAHAGVEVGATAGLHVFSINNELGVPDTVKATSLRNSALFGLRLGFMFNDMIGVEAEAGIIPSEDRNLVYDVFTGTVRGHVIAQFRAANPANKLVPFVVLGGGLMQVLKSDSEDIISKDTDETLYVGIGAKYRVDNIVGLFGTTDDDLSVDELREHLQKEEKEEGRRKRFIYDHPDGGTRTWSRRRDRPNARHGQRRSRRGSRSGCASCARPRPVVRRMLKGFERLKRPRLLPVRMVRPWRRRGRLRNSI